MDKIEFNKIQGGIWCPIFTLPRNEKKIQMLLQESAVPVYLPLQKHVNIQPVISKGKSYNYKRVLYVPMFKNYIFANVTPGLRSDLNRNRSVVKVFQLMEQDEDVLLKELQDIRKMEVYAETEKVDICNGLTQGVEVEFIDGLFAGSRGVVISLKDDMAYINITTIQAAIKMHYPAAWCKIIEQESV